MLASFSLSQTVTGFATTIGMDFYHFWGAPVAVRLTGHTLGAPYHYGERYQTVLKDYAATVKQPRLMSAQRFWDEPDFTATPLLYQAFRSNTAMLVRPIASGNYSTPLFVSTWTGAGSFVIAAVLLALSAGLAGIPLWALGRPSAMSATIALSWVPLWGALLLELRSPDRRSEEPTTGNAATSRARRQRK